MKKLPEVSRDLTVAANLIADGWCQGAFQTDDGICITQAIFLACGREPGRMVAAIDAVKDHLHCRPTCLAQWNDERGRTQAGVIQALQHAALKAAEEGQGG